MDRRAVVAECKVALQLYIGAGPVASWAGPITDLRARTSLTQSIPEPATLAFFAFGLAGLGFANR